MWSCVKRHRTEILLIGSAQRHRRLPIGGGMKVTETLWLWHDQTHTEASPHHPSRDFLSIKFVRCSAHPTCSEPALRSEEHASRWTVDLLVAASPRPLEVCCGC